jgi:hypothetical protein
MSRRTHYTRAKLVGRKWHKFVVSYDYAEHGSEYRISGENYGRFGTFVRGLLAELRGEYLDKNGGHFRVLMVEDDEDAVFLRLKCHERAYRGYGDWSQMKYSSAETNRIVK